MAAFNLGGFGGDGGGLGALGMDLPRGFEEQYHCYPVSFQDKELLEAGDKILLPPSALDALARQQVEYPMLFELSNPSQGNRTHCGVLEFAAPEGICYIPHWMMHNLLLEAGSLLTVKNVSLPKGKFVKFQPQSVDFLEMSNPRAVLETTMRHFSCLTEGDVICLPYNDRNYKLAVKELKPANAIGIVETDIHVDFDDPVGYESFMALKAAAAAGAAGAGGSGTTGAIGGSAINIPAPVSGPRPKDKPSDRADAYRGSQSPTNLPPGHECMPEESLPPDAFGSTNSTHSAGGGGGGGDSRRASFSSNGSTGDASASGARGGEAAPLPPGWDKVKTTTGEVYYVNHLDKTTSWDRPAPVAAAAPPAVAPVVADPILSFSPAFGSNGSAASAGLGSTGGGGELPPGWGMKQTPAGETYFVNHKDQTTSWERPVATPQAAAPPAAATVPQPAHRRGSGSGASSSVASAGSMGGSAAAAAGGKAPLPPGWESQIHDGRVVYIDHISQSTTWERPVAAARAARDARAAGAARAVSAGSNTRQQSSTSSAEAPLPPGWSAKNTPEGHTYYANHANKSTTWTRPTAAQATSSQRPPGSASGGAEAPLPPGWSAKNTPEGHIYYANHATKSTTWTRPTAAQEASSQRPQGCAPGRAKASLKPGSAGSVRRTFGSNNTRLSVGGDAAAAAAAASVSSILASRGSAVPPPLPTIGSAVPPPPPIRLSAVPPLPGVVGCMAGSMRSSESYYDNRATWWPQASSQCRDSSSAASTASSVGSGVDEGEALLPSGMGTVVERFDSNPATYVDTDSGIRLRVDPGCLSEGQVAGPINVIPDKRYIVESGGSSFLVSAPVECHPSGAFFQKPLGLEFPVGEEGADAGLEQVDEADEDREEYLASLEDNHKVFWRENVGEPWALLDGGSILFDKEIGEMLFQAKIIHFSLGCLGTKLNLQCPSQDKVVRFGRPRLRELEFMNATGKRLMFLVLPTCYADSALTSLALSLKAEGIGGGLDVNWALEKGILSSAMDFQVVPVSAKSAATNLRQGQECPYNTCTLSDKAGKEAKVALVTVDDHFVYVWFNKILPERTQLVVLPPMFSDPNGYATRRKLVNDPDYDVVNAAGMDNPNAPVAIISSGGASGGANSANPS